MCEAQTENNRLLEKAETLVFLSEFDEAESIYRYIISDAPEEWRAYVGLAKTLIFKLNEPMWSYEDMCKVYRDNKGGVESAFSVAFECERKAILLEPNSKVLFEELWDKYQKMHLVWKKQQEEKREENNRKAESAKQNAKKFMELICKNGKETKLDNLFKVTDFYKSNIKVFTCKFNPFNIDKYSLVYREYEYDHYEQGSNKCYHISEVVSIDDTNIRVNCISDSENDKSQFMLILKKEYSIDELFEAICEMQSSHEIAENRRANNMCVSCGSSLNHNEFCSNCSHLNKNLIQKKQEEIFNLINMFPDKVNVLEELFEKYGINKVLGPRSWNSVFGFLCVDSIGISLYKTYVRLKMQSKNTPYQCFYIETGNLSEIIDYLKNRKTSNVCQYCGGTFKGLFKVKCSNCGKEKDY